ncbi:MAG TPA: glycosyltransferase family 9 protein [Pyrinomonadaceae bacterium]|nr:glycosyltransferase family 9 protein [Pyrinomonadaceae bacterium]
MRIGHLGDTLVALPAFWSLRKAFPDAKLTLLSNSDRRNPNYLAPSSVLPANGLFDEFIDYPTNVSPVESIFGALRLALSLRIRKFDAVFYLMPRARTEKQIARDRQFFRISGIGRVLGLDYTLANSLAGPMPSEIPTICSESEFLLDLLENAGVPVDRASRSTALNLTELEKEAGPAFLAENGIDGGQRIIAIAPGSKWPSKIWFEERYAAAVERLIASHDVYPIVLGGPEDRECGERLVAVWGRGANAAGRLTVRESAALLEHCSLYLGNDTGTMHLAAAVGVKCVAIFAAIDYPGRWAPFGSGHQVFRRSVECEGCHTPDCFNAHKCLDLIGVEEVIRAVSMILSSH